MFLDFLLVGIGGFIGSVLRYSVSLFINRIPDLNFPFATFIVNVAGSFFIGLIIGLINSSNYQNIKLLFAVGICGGFTTFSSFALENISLLETKQTFLSLFYISASVFFGLIAVYIGLFISRKLTI